jgi:acetyl coenzyme A synthetase (ADP forming)-like protein
MPFFNPRGVAVIGASRDPHKPGHGTVRNLRDIGFRGAIYPVNPAATEILGYTCYQSVTDVPDPVDLAVIMVAAERVVQVIEQCARRGIRHAVVASGGFSEIGPAGRAYEQDLVQVARKHGMRVIGPNCIGTIDTYSPVNVTFTIGAPQPGDIGFISQSGALCVALMDWARLEGIGFSRLVSLGNQADVTDTEMLSALADDPHTRVITAYIEGLKDGQAFTDVAGQISRHKPVVVLKAGHGEGGAKAVMSHTGAIAGSSEAYRAAFRRCGVLQADTLQDLFDWARAAAWQPLPRNNQVAVLTNAGGVGILAVDALEARGLSLAPLGEQTRSALRAALPAVASVDNPVDVLAGSGPAAYALALNAMLSDPAVDAVIAIVAPQDWFLPVSLAEVIGETSSFHKKPVLASMMGLDPAHPALATLRQWRVPNFGFPDRAASALAAMVARRRWLDASPGSALDPAHVATWRQMAQAAFDRGDLAGLVSTYDIALPPGHLAHNVDEAVHMADQVGYPVAMKLVSLDITHKSEVGGVRLNLADSQAVRAAYARIIAEVHISRPDARIEGVLVQRMLTGGQEVIVGVRRDAQFGPLVLVGSGGVEVELVRDVALGIAPLTYAQAEELLDATQAGTRLEGWRGTTPGDRQAVLEAMVRLAQVACDFPAIAELEINTLYVLPQGQGAFAVDVRGAIVH